MPTAPRATDAEDNDSSTGLSSSGATTAVRFWKKEASGGATATSTGQEHEQHADNAQSKVDVTAIAPPEGGDGIVNETSGNSNSIFSSSKNTNTSPSEVTLAETIKRGWSSVVANGITQDAVTKSNSDSTYKSGKSGANSNQVTGGGGGNGGQRGWMWGVSAAKGGSGDRKDGQNGHRAGGWLTMGKKNGKKSSTEKDQSRERRDAAMAVAAATAAAAVGDEREVVLGEDGLPDWSVLTTRVGGLAKEIYAFKASCFVENDETDTQVYM